MAKAKEGEVERKEVQGIVKWDEKELEGLTEEEKKLIQAAYDQNVEDNLEGEVVSFPQIKVRHQVGEFEMPDGETMDTLEGVILLKAPAMAWWEKPLGVGESSIPDCFSRDGLTPDAQAGIPQSQHCRDCQQNKFGSAGTGRKGKACRNRRRLFLHIPDHEVPHFLSISPASLRKLSAYMVELMDNKLGFSQIKTKFGLDLQSGTFSYSLITFGVGEIISPREFLNMRKKADAIAAIVHGIPFAADEFLAEEETTTEGEPSETENDDLPF